MKYFPAAYNGIELHITVGPSRRQVTMKFTGPSTELKASDIAKTQERLAYNGMELQTTAYSRGNNELSRLA
jgi:hypothetical protein